MTAPRSLAEWCTSFPGGEIAAVLPETDDRYGDIFFRDGRRGRYVGKAFEWLDPIPGTEAGKVWARIQQEPVA